MESRALRAVTCVGIFYVLFGHVAHAWIKCEDPFVYLAGKCYWFYRGRTVVYRNRAASKCEAVDARLAHVTDNVTQAKLAEWIDRHEYRLTSYWIGLSNVNGNREYRWDNSDDEAAFTSWAEGQPGRLQHRNCVIMSATEAHEWEAVNCWQRNLFICERELRLSEVKALRFTDTLDNFCNGRSVGYYSDPTDCRKYILCFGKKMSRFRCPNNEVFNAENSMCGEEGSDAICGTSVEVTTSIPTTESTDSSDNDEDYGYGYDYKGGDYDYYKEGGEHEEPDYGSDGGGGGNENEEELEDFPDHVCEDPGYSKLGKKCYKMFYHPISWNVANQICIGEEGGRLATIKSKRSQKFLYDELKQHIYPQQNIMIFNYWIGLNDQKTPDSYVWSDGSTLKEYYSYENWSRQAKKRHKDLKKCVQISMLKKGAWEDSICADENGYICEKDAVNVSSTVGSNEMMHTTATSITLGWKSRNPFCGTSRRPDLPEAVIGGTTADMAQHPWQASLRSFGEHRCGGTLIDNCWVLTAAHCVDPRLTGYSKLPTLVVLGDVDTSRPEGTEKYLRIEKVVLHPDWTSTPVPTNDIALVKLGSCVNDLNPICLPGPDFDEFTENHACKVAGWGTMDATVSNYPSRLQEAQVPIISQSVCENKYMLRRNTLITDSMFCAGYLKGGIDTCQGDSGGPLACKGARYVNHAVQWGIVSWGFGCARRDKPGVYTKVANYMDWIREQTMVNF